MPRFAVVIPVKMLDGSIIMDGVIDMADDVAAALVAAGALLPAVEPQLDSDDEEDEEETSAKSEIDAVTRIISTLSPDDPGNWTSDGRPVLAVLSEALGRRVSAALRDAAWAKFISHNEAG